MKRRNQAEHLLELRRYDEARDVLTALLAETPEDEQLVGLMAGCLIGIGDNPGALAMANRMVGLAPNEEWGHRLASVALDRMGRPEEATVAAANAVRLAPLEYRTHVQYAMAAVDAPGKLADARTAAARAVELEPNIASTHFAVGVVAHARNEVDVAKAAYERALAIDPEHAMAINNLTVLGGSRSIVRAAQGFAHSLRLDPQGNELVLQNVDGLVVQFVRRLYFASLAGLIVGLAAGLAGGGVESSQVTPVTAAVGIVVLVGTVGYTVALARNIPLGVRRYVTRRLVSNAYFVCNLLLALSMFAIALITCLVPGGVVVGLVALRPIGLANVAMVVWTYVKFR